MWKSWIKRNKLSISWILWWSNATICISLFGSAWWNVLLFSRLVYWLPLLYRPLWRLLFCEQQRGGHFLLISERLVFWNACGPSPHWQNSCVCLAAFAASQSLKGLKTCFSLSAASTNRFKLVFRGNALCVPWNLGKGHVEPQWCHGRWEQAWVLSQLSCYQMADIICKTGRSARLICALMCPNDGFASCKVAVGVCMHVLKLKAWHNSDFCLVWLSFLFVGFASVDFRLRIANLWLYKLLF